MKLLTKELRKKLPPLYSVENEKDPLVICKFFTPDSNWTWYALEFDGKDTFFGWVVGFEKELGYFSLTELEGVKGPLGLPIERDLYFEPCRLSEMKAYHEKLEGDPLEAQLSVLKAKKIAGTLSQDDLKHAGAVLAEAVGELKDKMNDLAK
ncbi:MAG TPA: DUF2958 domain-containing protein [Candidatus Bathyarchaeia archaeon]|nr:DUF2958 domain-containing protein [Candidatus Bathyarchaeia archaeon]